MRRVSCLLLALGLIVAAAAPARATWEEELSEQVREEFGCVVSFLSQVVDRTVDGRRIVMARIHCEDKRTFDAYRDDDMAPFEIKTCEKPDAEAC